MSTRGDKAVVAGIRSCLDQLYELCREARRVGLSVSMEVSLQDDEELKEIPRVDAWLTRRYEL